MAQEKLVIAVFDQGVEPDVLEVLAEQGIAHWTRISDVHGSGREGTKEGSPVWPGLNTMLLLVLTEEQVQPLVDRLHEVRDSFPVTPGMRFIVTDAAMI
jgi:hypothetical protein